MQQNQNQLHNHLIPVNPSWVFSGALLVLAVLPHQVPSLLREILHSWVGLSIGISIAFWLFVCLKQHLLAVSLFMFVAIHYINSFFPERFRGSRTKQENLNKDSIPLQNKKKWFDEETMIEEPTAIQERTDSDNLLFDKIHSSSNDEDHFWYSEETFEEYPIAIQERTINRN